VARGESLERANRSDSEQIFSPSGFPPWRLGAGIDAPSPSEDNAPLFETLELEPAAVPSLDQLSHIEIVDCPGDLQTMRSFAGRFHII
jgi:hypothetical protein